MVILRDMIESDIEDYVRWFTSEVDWMNYDAPWESIDQNISIEEERKSWKEYFESVKDITDEEIRWKYEIEYDGKHVGWVSRYFDLDYLDNVDKIPAIGIDIPEVSIYNNGVGTKALTLFIDYLKTKGYKSLFLQTWSGNTRMMHVAEKLGFKIYYVKKDYRIVKDNKYNAITFKLDII